MRNFPLFMNTRNETIVIVGGGEIAAQKSRLVARSEARLVLMADELNEELAALVASGRAEHLAEVLAPDHLAARLVILATGCAGFDAAAADLARRAGALVNVVDRPSLCDVNMPAIVDRDPVVIAIGTEGTAPVLARRVKSALETMLEPGLGQLAALAGRLRPRVAHRIAPKDRRAFWEWVFGPVRRGFREAGLDQAEAEIEAVLASRQVPGRGEGLVSLIEIPANDTDMIPLRAASRLQSADFVAVGEGVPGDVLELARRDAERGALGADELRQPGQNIVALSTDGGALLGLQKKLEADGIEVELIRPAPGAEAKSALKLVS